MSTELVEVTSKEITRAISQDSEYDDTLEVPDSLEITIDENGETIQISKEEIECTNNKEGMNLYSINTSTFLYILHFLLVFIS